MQVLDNKTYVAGEILDQNTKTRNRNIKLQLLELSRQRLLPNVDMYITTDDWPQKSQANLNPACPVQGPVFCQVLPSMQDHFTKPGPAGWILSHFTLSTASLLQAKRNSRRHAVLIPDWSFHDWYGDQNPGWADLKYILQAASDDISWHSRLPTLFFRGSSETGERSICLQKWHLTSSNQCKVMHWSVQKQRPQTCHQT